MKYTALKAFEKHLQSAAPNHFSDCYMILGKDDFQRKAAVDMLIKFLQVGQKNAELLLTTFDGENNPIQAVFQELNTLSMFSGKRVIILHQADKLNKAATQLLEDYFQKANRQTYFILTAPSLHHGTNFYKKMEKAGVVLEIAEEKAWEKEKNSIEWIHETLAKEGKKMDGQACQILVKQVGPDQAVLFQELQKLVCYIGDRANITLADVGAIATNCNIESVWQLGESIFKKDVAGSLKISKSLLKEGVQILALIRQMRSQFQTDYQVCCILHNGGGSEEITKSFPYMKGYILDLHLNMARQYGIERFKQGILSLDEAELMAKNSMMDPEFLLEKLIIKLAA